MALYQHLAFQGLFLASRTVSAVDDSANTLTVVGHGLRAAMSVRVASTGTLPAPLVADTTYYLKVTDADTLQLATTTASAAINLTSAGSGTITVKPEAGTLVKNTSTKEMIPVDLGNAAYNAYLDWAVSTLPDAEAIESVGDARKRAIVYINSKTESLLATVLPVGGSRYGLAWNLMLEEALVCDADGSPTTGEYPILDTRVGKLGATLAEVADNVIAERDTWRARIVTLETVRAQAEEDILAASTAAAVDAVVAAISWPA